MLAVVKKDEADMRDALATEAGFLTMLCSYEDEPLQYDDYQLRLLMDRSRYRWVEKARQLGFSFLFAGEALARSHLRKSHTSVFVSYNLDDAKEKINYARALYDGLPLAYRKNLVVDSKTELVFESTTGKRKVSRIISVPSKAPRGKKGDVYLDELAHYTEDRTTYSGSTALILRSKGQLTGCSTPLGARGVFWEIASEELRKYRSYSRHNVPWWHSRFYCKDVRRALREAPHMSTEERVEKFGTQAIQDQLEALTLDYFQQEFECVYLDQKYTYYPYELILPCTTDDAVRYEDFQDFPEDIGRLVAGYDVGRTTHLSALAIVEEEEERKHLRFWRDYDQEDFGAQEADLDRMFATLPIARLSIDQNGIGRHLTENLVKKYDEYIRPENFTNESKELWATDFKLLLRHRNFVAPKDRGLVAEINSIKRTASPKTGKPVFEAKQSTQSTAAGKKRKSHGDVFWALALACQKERFASAGTGEVDVAVRILG